MAQRWLNAPQTDFNGRLNAGRKWRQTEGALVALAKATVWHAVLYMTVYEGCTRASRGPIRSL